MPPTRSWSSPTNPHHNASCSELSGDSTAKTNPIRAVEAYGCGTLPLRSDANTVVVSASGRARRVPRAVSGRISSVLESCATVHSSSTSSARRGTHDETPLAASTSDGQAPVHQITSRSRVSGVGADRAPPGCGFATALPLGAGSAWPVDPRAVAPPPALKEPAVEIRHASVAMLALVDVQVVVIADVQDITAHSTRFRPYGEYEQLLDRRDDAREVQEAMPLARVRGPAAGWRVDARRVGAAASAGAPATAGGASVWPRRARRGDAPRSRQIHRPSTLASSIPLSVSQQRSNPPMCIAAATACHVVEVMQRACGVRWGR